MQIINGFFIILAHLVAGNLLSELMDGFVPGSVVGMVLMFISLMTGFVKDYQIRKVATFLTDNMTVFFLPAFMGIMELWGLTPDEIIYVGDAPSDISLCHSVGVAIINAAWSSTAPAEEAACINLSPEYRLADFQELAPLIHKLTT